MKTKLLLPLTLVGLTLTACQDEDFGYKSYEPDKVNTDYSLRFVNRDDVNVNINSETDGAPYYIYFENPCGEDGLYNGATAYLMSRTPIQTKLSVPRHIDKLYVTSPNREMRVLPVGDVNINEQNLFGQSTATRVNTDPTAAPYALPEGMTKPYYFAPYSDDFVQPNPDVNDALMNFVHSNYPSATGQSLIKAEDVAKNTDLVVPSADDAEYTALWITWLGMGVGDQACRVWFYVYPDSYTANDFSNNMDMPLWGRADSIDINKGKPNRDTPLFDSKVDAIGTSVFVGYIKSGYRIGFAYQCYEANGQQGKVRYSTPGMNADVVGTGKTPAAGGVTINRTVDDHVYNIVGLERDTWRVNGNTIATDQDFNDALLLVEASLPVKPKEIVPIDPPASVEVTKGYYLFEDLNGSASNNDNDFNDVVIYYEKAIYTTNDGLETANNYQCWCDFTVDLLANACENINAVGLYHKKPSVTTPITTILFEDVTGLNNMEVAPAYDGTTQIIKEHLSMDSKDDIILPFLRSVAKGGEYNYDPNDPQAYDYDLNRFNIYTTTYGTKEYPYAIEVPYVERVPFCWMKEGLIITNGYGNWKTASDWYATPTNADNLVPRTPGALY